MPHTRSAVVTGAGSGIGRATSRRLAEDGWHVLAVDVSRDGVAETVDVVQTAGGKAAGHALDVTDDAAVQRVFDDVAWSGGRSKVLVNVAGVGVAAPLAATTDEDWHRVLGVNLTAVFLTCRAALPLMIRAGGGVIVNVASVAGLVGVKNRAAYCASKAGVIGLTRSIAADYAAAGIRANAICPGTVATEWVSKILANDPNPQAALAAMDARQLDGRMGTPEEVAAGIAFLVGDDGRFVNGSAFVMDGGMTAV